MSHRGPRPLLDDDASDAPSFVLAALREARADVPSAARIEALSRSIASAIGGLPPAGSGGPAKPEGGPAGRDASGADAAGAPAGAAGAVEGTARLAGSAKLALGGFAVVAALGAAFVVTRPRASEGASTGLAEEGAATPTSLSSAPPKIAAQNATMTQGSSSEHVTPSFDVHALPEASTARASEVAARAASTSSEITTATSEAEMRVLRAAQDVLGSDPGETLARCDEHARLYPHGALAEEREVLAVTALLRLGRRPDAEARAARFRSKYPGSAYVRRLDTLLARE